MILADTSVWVDHLRGRNRKMTELLGDGEIAMHPFVVAEIALDSLHHRRERLEEMDALRQVKVAHLVEVRHMTEVNSLYSKGIGLTDAHLIASCLLTPGTWLWTYDRDLKKAAKSLGVLVDLP